MQKKVIDCKDNFGRFFEDFSVGTILKHWPGKTITESDNNLFSLLTMNHHPVHLDVEYCKKHQHGNAQHKTWYRITDQYKSAGDNIERTTVPHCFGDTQRDAGRIHD